MVTTTQSQYRFLKTLLVVGLLCCCVFLLFNYLSNTQYLIFSQQYPISVCSTSKKGKCSHASSSDLYSWPVHGIWWEDSRLSTIYVPHSTYFLSVLIQWLFSLRPTYTRGSYPEFCLKINFDLDVLQSIKTDLNERWYSIFGDNVEFWKHEWSKHGTCATDETPLKNELNYFKQGLEWNREYPIKDILARQNIKPRDDSTYSVYDIHQAFKSELGVRVGLSCVKWKVSISSYRTILYFVQFRNMI